ncbi:MAG: acyl-CoA dehydrogenase, partial [Paraglaciecola sp.]
MQTFIWLLILLATVGAVSYFRMKLFNATLIVAIVMLVGSFLGMVGAVLWLLFLIIALPLNIESIRKKHMTTPILDMYKKIMPEMSSTEKDAIDAGTVWWDGEIFSGNPNWHALHRIPQARLTSEEREFLEGPVAEVCRMANDWDITHKRADLSPQVWQFLKDNKFFAMIIKKQYGGLDFSAYAQSRVLQKLSGVSAVLSTTVGVPNSLGPGELLQHYGTKEQQDHYLPRLATGEEIPCFALTGPEAGSDAGSLPDSGIVCKGQWEGEEVIGMRLTFDKRYITLAPVATVIGLAFKMFDPDGLIGEKKELGITCAMLPRDTEGLEIGNRHFPLNVPFQNGPLRGTDIFVPLDYIIGGVEMAGQGWRMLVECLSVGRCITLPSASAGGAKSLALATGAYARIRRQFKLPIGNMEGIEEMLARIGGNAYLMDAVTSLTTKGVDLGEKPSVISAICKYHLTEKIRQLVNDSMDVHG